jgi:hypothetical protein
MDDTKTLQILLSYGLDQSSLQQTTSGINSTTSALAAQQQQLRSSRMELREMSQVFTAIGLAGAAIYVPAIAASQAYLKSAGQNEALSRAWLADTDKIKQSTIDVGRVVTEGLLPGYTQVANIVAQFSAFADKNPQLIQAAVGLAGGLVAIAAAGKVFTEVDRAVVDIQLIAAGIMKKAADEQVAAAGGMAASKYGVPGGLIGPAGAPAASGLIATIAPFVIPIIAAVGGAAIYDAIKPKGAPSAVQSFSEANADIYSLFNKPILDKLGPFGKSVEKFDESVLKFQLGATGVKGFSANPTTGGLDATTFQTGLTDFTAYQKRLNDIQKQYNDAALQEQQSYAQTSLQDTLTYQKLQQTQLDAYNQASAQAEQNYQDTRTDELEKFNQSQADTIRNYHESELQAQQSYQNALADLEKSHKDKLQDLTKNHDVLGIESETRSYEEQKAQKTRDFNQSEAQRKAQLAQTLSDAQRNFNEQQAEEKANYDASKKQRDDAFKAQQKTDAANYADEMNQLASDHIVKMAQLKANYDDQNKLEQTAFQANMNALVGIVDASTVAISMQYQAFLKSLGINTPANPSLPGVTGGENKFTHDLGGYFMPGTTRNATGRPEYVIAPDTVKYAENLVGGRLTQQNLIAAMISGRGASNGGSNYRGGDTVNMSGLTAQDRLLVGGMVKQALAEFKQRELS